jgi:hypothetical protein
MTTPRALPTLFGRHALVLSKHEDLAAALELVRDTARQLAAENTPHPQELALRALLADLRVNLERHFQAEESQEYFGALVADSPTLAGSVATLRRQHRAMLAILDALALLACGARARKQFETTVSILINTFHSHERAEALLIRGYLAGEDETA